MRSWLKMEATATSTTTSPIRTKIRSYTSSLIVGITTIVLLSVVQFLPGGYILAVLLGVGLALLYQKEQGLTLITLYILTYFAIIWQLLGFGFFQLLVTPVGLIIVLALIVPLLSFIVLRPEGISIALVILSVSLMLTPVYFLSIPLVLLGILFEGLGSARVQSINFVLLMTPFVILENGIYYSTLTGVASNAPIIFSQLSNLANNLRPPLSGINLLQGTAPANYVYSHALSVSDFMLSRSYVVYIPLILFAAVLIVTISVANFLTNSLLKRISIIEVTRNYSKIFAPIVASVIVALAFIAMMLGLSPRAANVLQTGISVGVGPYFMIAASVGVAGLLTGTELLTERLERTQMSAARLEELLSILNDKITKIGAEMNEISADAPSIDLSSQKKTLAEYVAYSEDMKKRLQTASYDSFQSWTSDIENRIIPSLELMPKQFMVRLTSGLGVLTSASLTANSHLDESRATGPRYPPVNQFDVPGEQELDEVLKIYQRALDLIQKTTIDLFDRYVESIRSYSDLMQVEEVAPPVSPAALLASRDYITAMKLVSEDYWLNFYVRENEKYAEKLRIFLDALSKIADVSNDEDHEQLSRLLAASADTSPSSASLMLQNVTEVIEFLRDSIEHAIEEIETVKKLVASVDPSFSNVLKLNTTGILDEMLAIQNKMRGVKPEFSDAIAISKEAAPILLVLSEYRRMDSESLVVISQYPVAVKLLRQLFDGNQEVVRISELPFQRDVAKFFVKIFAASNGSYKYNEELEELSFGHDKMYQRS